MAATRRVRPVRPRVCDRSDSFLQDSGPEDHELEGLSRRWRDRDHLRPVAAGAPDSDTSSCCGQPEYPNLAAPAAGRATGSDGIDRTTATGPTGSTGATGDWRDRKDGHDRPAGPKPQPGENAGGGKVGLLLLSPYDQGRQHGL